MDADANPDELPSRSDLALWEKAIRQDWPMPQPVKKQILQTAVNLCEPDEPTPAKPDGPPGEEGDSEPAEQYPGWRRQIRALAIIARFGDLNIRQQAIDLRRAEHERRKALDRRGPEAYASPVDPAAAERALRALNGPDTDDDGDHGERPPQPA